MKLVARSIVLFLVSLVLATTSFPAHAQKGAIFNTMDGFITGMVGPELWPNCVDQPSRENWLGGDCQAADVTAMHMLNSSIMAMYAPPVSSQEYIAYVMQNSAFSDNNQAYAQGVGLGFASLSPVLGIWRVFLNISYFFFVIAFMIVGFAIMFRAKINAQTVVNIQMALPQLIITLVLISFSYAIAGLLVDAMFLTTQFITAIAAQNIFDGTNFTANELQTITFENSIIANSLGFILGNVGEFNSISVIAGEGLGEIVYDMLGGGQGFILTDILGGMAAFTAGTVFAIILIGVMLWNAFKILFSLLTSYIMIILLVITAPLRLLLNIYPGSNAFMSWLRELTGHLAVFPTVVAMIFLMYALMGINTGPGIGYSDETGAVGFSPPQLGFSAANAVQGLIGIAILLAIPQVIDQVKEFFGVKGGSGGGAGGAFGGALLGGGLGAAISPLGRMAMAPGQAALGIGSRFVGGAAADIGGAWASQQMSRMPLMNDIIQRRQNIRQDEYIKQQVAAQKRLVELGYASKNRDFGDAKKTSAEGAKSAKSQSGPQY